MNLVRCVCGRDVEIPEGKTYALCPNCGGLVPPPSGNLPPPPPGSRAAHPNRTPLLVIAIVVGLTIVLMLSCAGIFGTMMYKQFNEGMRLGKSAVCNRNLRRVGVALVMYAGENKDQYPPLPAEPGRLMFATESVFPEYISDPTELECPMQDLPEFPQPEDYIDDESYFYLSHALLNDREGAAFVEAYKKCMDNGLPMEGDIAVAAGSGSAGKDRLMALRRGVENLLAADPLDPGPKQHLAASIPVLVEWPGHHTKPGGNVCYLDGHVAFVPYPGPFPMTQKFIEAMEDLDE
jgi:prepilin-type processing-associated H-X9-DG protein